MEFLRPCMIMSSTEAGSYESGCQGCSRGKWRSWPWPRTRTRPRKDCNLVLGMPHVKSGDFFLYRIL